jgi:hypothetical protein
MQIIMTSWEFCAKCACRPIGAPVAIAMTIALAPTSDRMQNFAAAHERLDT